MTAFSNKVTGDRVKAFYDAPHVVDHYRRATANVGLWLSEEVVFRKVFQPEDRILELGAGTGRIAIGLAEIGYKHILATELSMKWSSRHARSGKCWEFRSVSGTRMRPA